MSDKTFHSLTLPGVGTAKVPLTANEYSIYIDYAVNDYCTYQGKLYKCIATHAHGDWNSTHFTETIVSNELNDRLRVPAAQNNAPSNPRVGDLWIDTDEDSPVYNLDPVPTNGSSNAVTSTGLKATFDAMNNRKVDRDVVAGDYSDSATYRVGDLVMKGNLLYRCITAIRHPEAWDYTHWVATTLNTEFIRARTMAKYVVDSVDVQGNITFSQHESFIDIEMVLIYGGIVTAVVDFNNSNRNDLFFVPLSRYTPDVPLLHNGQLQFESPSIIITHNATGSVTGRLIPR